MNLPTSGVQNGCLGNAGCLATGPRIIDFMTENARYENATPENASIKHVCLRKKYVLDWRRWTYFTFQSRLSRVYQICWMSRQFRCLGQAVKLFSYFPTRKRLCPSTAIKGGVQVYHILRLWHVWNDRMWLSVFLYTQTYVLNSSVLQRDT